MKMQQKKINGFTIVEMLVIVAIISILAGLTSFSVGYVRAKNRDSNRKTDFNKIKLALEQYKEKSGTYPNPADYESSPNPAILTIDKSNEPDFLSPLVSDGILVFVPGDPYSAYPKYIPDYEGHHYEYGYLPSSLTGMSENYYVMICPIEQGESEMDLPPYIYSYWGGSDPRGAIRSWPWLNDALSGRGKWLVIYGKE